MKKKVNFDKNQNYLDYVPEVAENIEWQTKEDELVTLKIENKGAFNFIFQKLFKKPRFSYIHLDEFGSFAWKKINGVDSLFQIGIFVEEHFGDKAYPLYERLSKFFSILESYGFIYMKKN